MCLLLNYCLFRLLKILMSNGSLNILSKQPSPIPEHMQQLLFVVLVEFWILWSIGLFILNLLRACIHTAPEQKITGLNINPGGLFSYTLPATLFSTIFISPQTCRNKLLTSWRIQEETILDMAAAKQCKRPRSSVDGAETIRLDQLYKDPLLRSIP